MRKGFFRFSRPEGDKFDVDRKDISLGQEADLSNWRTQKEMTKELEKQGIEVPKNKWERKKFFEDFQEKVEKADRYGRKKIDLPEAGNADDHDEPKKKSGWF